MRKIAEHKAWLQRIRHERPNPAHHFKVAVYIRYFNQTKHENYLDYHIKQFEDTLALCANWEFVGFYIDEGSTPPNMESAPEWCRLLDDCMEGKVDLIITQKVRTYPRRAMRFHSVPDYSLSRNIRLGSTLFPRICSLWPPTTWTI